MKSLSMNDNNNDSENNNDKMIVENSLYLRDRYDYYYWTL